MMDKLKDDFDFLRQSNRNHINFLIEFVTENALK